MTVAEKEIADSVYVTLAAGLKPAALIKPVPLPFIIQPARMKTAICLLISPVVIFSVIPFLPPFPGASIPKAGQEKRSRKPDNKKAV